MRPLFEKENMHSKFLFKNSWIKNFLPNSMSWKGRQNPDKNTSIIEKILFIPEIIAKNLQLFYMKKKRTTELITPSLLAFHPKDMQTFILKEYEERIKKYAI
jgi:hypothetical protein